MFNDADAQDPFTRGPSYGFRLAKALDDRTAPEAAAVIPLAHRDYANEKPVQPEVAQAYRRHYAYDRTPLDARTEETDDSADRWRKEKVSFTAAYGGERVTAYLLTPRAGHPPYPVVVVFPGSNAIHERSSKTLPGMRLLAPILRSGRAVVYPVYKSTFERGDALDSDYQAPTTFYRDHVIMWAKDLGRSLDWIESRKDLDGKRIAYYGASWGAFLAPVMLAVEERIKVGLLVGGGLEVTGVPARGRPVELPRAGPPAGPDGEWPLRLLLPGGGDAAADVQGPRHAGEGQAPRAPRVGARAAQRRAHPGESSTGWTATSARPAERAAARETRPGTVLTDTVRARLQRRPGKLGSTVSVRREATMNRFPGTWRPRFLAAVAALLGLSACGSSTPDCMCIAPGGTWSPHAALSLGPRQEMGVAAVDGKVYVVGGFDDSGQAVATVEAYDPSTNRWTQRASLPSPLHHVNVAGVGSKLYVVGGLTGSSFAASRTTLVYDPAQDSWAPLTSMPAGTERGASGVAVLDGRIVVAGGLRGASVTDASVFDPQTNAWSPLQPLAVARDHLAAATVGGRVYAVAGRDQGALKAALEVLDAASGTWSRRADIPTARGGVAAAELSGRLVVLGGEGNRSDPAGIFHQTESYDPSADAWRTDTQMLTGRHGIGAAVVGDRLYVPGGATEEGFGAVAVNESFSY